MTRSTFDQRMLELARFVADKPLDQALAQELNTEYAAGSDAFRELSQLCLQGLAEGWLCQYEAGGIRYGRVIKPSPEMHDFSVDVVLMNDVVGPHHRHPQGEIDLIMPTQGDAQFDGHGAGWMVYGPDTQHSPTVTQGEALVLYLLPGGAIEFTRAAA